MRILLLGLETTQAAIVLSQIDPSIDIIGVSSFNLPKRLLHKKCELVVSVTVDDIYRELEGKHIDLVFPMNDFWANISWELEELLCPKIGYWSIDRRTYNQAVNKFIFATKCIQNNIRIPTIVESFVDILPAKKYIIKPYHTSGARGMYQKYGSDITEKEFAKDGFFVQEYIQDSKQFKFTGYCKSGKLIKGYEFYKMDYYPLSGGSTSYGEYVETGMVRKMALKIIEKFNWSGIIDIDFIMCNQGIMYAMEINPRLPAVSSFLLKDNSLLKHFHIPLVESKNQEVVGIRSLYLRLTLVSFFTTFNSKYLFNLMSVLGKRTVVQDLPKSRMFLFWMMFPFYYSKNSKA